MWAESSLSRPTKTPILSYPVRTYRSHVSLGLSVHVVTIIHIVLRWVALTTIGRKVEENGQKTVRKRLAICAKKDLMYSKFTSSYNYMKKIIALLAMVTMIGWSFAYTPAMEAKLDAVVFTQAEEDLISRITNIVWPNIDKFGEPYRKKVVRILKGIERKSSNIRMKAVVREMVSYASEYWITDEEGDIEGLGNIIEQGVSNPWDDPVVVTPPVMKPIKVLNYSYLQTANAQETYNNQAIYIWAMTKLIDYLFRNPEVEVLQEASLILNHPAQGESNTIIYRWSLAYIIDHEGYGDHKWYGTYDYPQMSYSDMNRVAILNGTCPDIDKIVWKWYINYEKSPEYGNRPLSDPEVMRGSRVLNNGASVQFIYNVSINKAGAPYPGDYRVCELTVQSQIQDLP